MGPTTRPNTGKGRRPFPVFCLVLGAGVRLILAQGPNRIGPEALFYLVLGLVLGLERGLILGPIPIRIGPEALLLWGFGLVLGLVLTLILAQILGLITCIKQA